MKDNLHEILEQVRTGQLEIDSAVTQIEEFNLPNLGFAHVDLQRKRRCGFPEVIFCQGKTPEWVAGVVQKLIEANQDCLATRVNDDQATYLAERYPNGEQDRVARTFWLPVANEERSIHGRIVVLTAGTSDLPVAQEAVVTARAMGCEVHMFADVGVAGIHRVLRYRDEYAKADVIIVVAGMDGALPSVVGGLVDCPVIAVPTSIGYGAAFGGVSALLTMLNSCSASVVVVNIDSGFKGGYVAAMIARQSKPRSE